MVSQGEPSIAEIGTNLQRSSTKSSLVIDFQALNNPPRATVTKDASNSSLDNVLEEQRDLQSSLVEGDQHLEGNINDGAHHRLRIQLEDGGCADPSCEKDVKTETPLYVEFTHDDPRNPVNFSRKKKWAITAVACFGTVTVSAASSSYNLGFPSMIKDLNCTQFEATAGLSLYAFGFAVVPLVTAAFSEEFGRLPLYLASSVGFALMYVMIALAKNIKVVLIARFLQGSFGSTGAITVGGSIADIWSAKERGLPMSIFSLSAVGSACLGPVFSGWIEMNPHLQWKWIQWIQMIVACVYTLLLPIVMEETRSSILLTRIARKLRKETGDSRYRARVEDERASLSRLIWISCTRPIYLMTTEPVVMSFSLWVGFAWGIVFCMIESVGAVFETLHGFNNGQIGTIFLSMFIGSLLGFVTNFFQETLYQRNVSRRGPEARLYAACFAAVLFPVGMFIYGYSASPDVHWIALAIGITIFAWATFLIYVVIFSYLADCYGPYASSALAGQSLARNLMATAFPLFTTQMYHNLSFKRANILFGAIAAIMSPIPFILFFRGPAIRRYSKFSRAVMEAEQEKLDSLTPA